MLTIAIIGSGPAGYYTAESLSKKMGSNVQIDIYDRLPTPFGLVRSGVAPDHQSIKAVVRRFEKTQAGGDIRFLGNISIPKDLTITDLQCHYDAVVIATGAPIDKELGIPGEDARGVLGASRFVSWYNGHPDFADLKPAMDTDTAVIIGNGNVALDVSRMLIKSSKELESTDIAQHAIESLAKSRIRKVIICGRRSVLHVGFSPKEIREFANLERAVPVIDTSFLPADTDIEAIQDKRIKKVLTTLRSYGDNDPESKACRVHFVFLHSPVEVISQNGQAIGVRLEVNRMVGDRAVGTGRMEEITCGLVISCIGTRSRQLEDLPFDSAAGRYLHENGLIAPGIYCAGWTKRGSTGTIGTNQDDGAMVAQHIAAHVTPSGKAGRAGIEPKLAALPDIISFEGWQAIDAIEIERAKHMRPQAPRIKIVDRSELIKSANMGKGADATCRT